MKKILLLAIAFRIFTANAQVSDPLTQLPVSVLSQGTPGPAAKIFIRCGGTITNENKPLTVVDGVPTGGNDLKSIHPNNIVSISILKNPTACALYGSGAMQGVVIISTKKANEKTLFVLDADDKTPLAGATVKIVSAKNGNDTVTVVAGKNGEVTTLLLKSKLDIEVLVTSVGYETLQTKIQFHKNKVQPRFLLKRKFKKMEEVRITTYTTIRCHRFGCGLRCTRIYCYRDTTETKTSSNDFTVYPNPAKANSFITVQTKNGFQGLLHLVNSAGQVLLQKRINSKATAASFSFPLVAAGVYFIQLADEHTGKSSTQKLMVQ